jgi:hypothetical protein
MDIYKQFFKRYETIFEMVKCVEIDIYKGIQKFISARTKIDVAVYY